MNERRRANLTMTWKLLAIAAGSFGFGFALVPLYNVLCSVTGYGDQAKLLQKVSAIEHPDPSRTVTVEFLTEVGSAGSMMKRTGSSRPSSSLKCCGEKQKHSVL